MELATGLAKVLENSRVSKVDQSVLYENIYLTSKDPIFMVLIALKV